MQQLPFVRTCLYQGDMSDVIVIFRRFSIVIPWIWYPPVASINELHFT